MATYFQWMVQQHCPHNNTPPCSDNWDAKIICPDCNIQLYAEHEDSWDEETGEEYGYHYWITAETHQYIWGYKP